MKFAIIEIKGNASDRGFDYEITAWPSVAAACEAWNETLYEHAALRTLLDLLTYATEQCEGRVVLVTEHNIEVLRTRPDRAYKYDVRLARALDLAEQRLEDL